MAGAALRRVSAALPRLIAASAVAVAVAVASALAWAGAGAGAGSSAWAQDAAAPAAPLGPQAAPLPASRGAVPLGETQAQRLCRLIEAAAEAEGLPKPFFARLIWTESRFDIRAVSPAGAQGVAQFMPATAAERGLADPFDPATAIPASAALLADLRGDFGNLGLAAAAYNAGADRVDRWRRGRARLPLETRRYVNLITGRSADWFLGAGREHAPAPLAEGKSFAEGCAALPVMRTRAVSRPPWGVVVAGGHSRAAALSRFARVRGLAASQAPGAPVHVQKRRRRETGPTYTVRMGAPTMGQAAAICRRLRARGVPCRIARN
ncbi:MAG: lytic transglycosylase domain-containing protein [Pseudomonadota bacterium]